jgi:hypothetical protein
MWRWFIVWLVAFSFPAHAENDPVDCSKQSLAVIVGSLKAKDTLVTFTGTCNGPVVIATDGLTLRGVGTAIIDGGGQDAVEIIGASRVALIDIEVRNGKSGIVARDGSHITVSGAELHHNAGAGIAVLTSSSAALSNVSVHHNGTMGLLADDGVSVHIANSMIAQNVGSDLQLTFGARADIRALIFGTYTCDATALVRGNSGITCPH